MLEQLQSPNSNVEALRVSPETRGRLPGPVTAAGGSGGLRNRWAPPGRSRRRREPGPEPPAGRSRAAAWRREAAGPHTAWPGTSGRPRGYREEAERGATRPCGEPGEASGAPAEEKEGDEGGRRRQPEPPWVRARRWGAPRYRPQRRLPVPGRSPAGGGGGAAPGRPSGAEAAVRGAPGRAAAARRLLAAGSGNRRARPRPYSRCSAGRWPAAAGP